ncbi:MAG TPA: YetF domain-containing protein, partial [Thermoanaerobaculia bacterium]|nr:YetF domain-containing protein [Thermoanaerobaculia bacterium]
LLATTRASGKRVVQQAAPFDFVVALILGDVIDDCLWAEVPVAKYASAVGSIVACDLLVKLAASRSALVFRIVHGKSRVLLQNGEENGHELRREQLNEGDLAHLLRLHGVDDWKDVQAAVLEEGAEVSVVPVHDALPATKQDAPRVREMLR